MELLQIRRDTGKATYESVDIDVQHIVAATDITPEERTNVLEQYASRVAAEEVKSQKKWVKGKQGVEGLAERCAAKIVSEEERTYTVQPKRHERKPRSRRQNVNKERFNPAPIGVQRWLTQPVPYPPADYSVPPPNITIPFRFINRTRISR